MGCYPPDNTGAFGITGNTADMGKFKAPTLRNIAITGPYMHDGSIATLDEKSSITTRPAGAPSPTVRTPASARSPARASSSSTSISPRQRADILAFLDADRRGVHRNPRFADPFLPLACPGDCGLDGTVAVNELVAAVGVSLGSEARWRSALPADANGDGAVTVRRADPRHARYMLDGCPG